MVDKFSISLNDTFSIEEEDSFLHHFGTPIHFKKLMEKPATIPIKSSSNFKDSFIDENCSILNSNVIDNLKSINISNKEIKNFTGKDLTNFNFVSPMPSVKNVRIKQNLCKMEFSILSPINFNLSNQSCSTPLIHNECSYMQSTPNQNESVIKTKVKSSIRTETKITQFSTPNQKVSSNMSQNTLSLARNLNCRKFEAEKQDIGNRNQSKPPFTATPAGNQSIDLSLERKLREFHEYRRKVEPIMVQAEKELERELKREKQENERRNQSKLPLKRRVVYATPQPPKRVTNPMTNSVKATQKFKSSIRTETQNSPFSTQNKRVSSNMSPDTLSLVRNLNRRKAEAEAEKQQQIANKRKLPENFIEPRTFDEMAKSFEEKMREFHEYRQKVDPIMVEAEKELEREVEREKQRNQSKQSIKPRMDRFTAAYTTPQLTKRVTNQVTNSVKAKQNLYNRKKFDFVTPVSTLKSKTGLAPTPTRWK